MNYELWIQEQILKNCFKMYVLTELLSISETPENVHVRIYIPFFVCPLQSTPMSNWIILLKKYVKITWKLCTYQLICIFDVTVIFNDFTLNMKIGEESTTVCECECLILF